MTTRIAGKRVLALILAGGKGTRLGVLTQGRAKPALGFAGVYHLIDFPLSNCVHSGLSDVWVLEQYELHTLNEHLAGGRPWDLDRTRGGLRVLPPFQGEGQGETLAQGNAHALLLNLRLLREYAPDVLLVLSSDQVYLLDYADVIERHVESGAAVTMVTTRVPEGENARRFGNVLAGPDGRIGRFAYKPDEPLSDLITAEVFAYDAPTLFEALERLSARGEPLGDYGDELLPRLVESGRAFEYRFEGYWRDVGTLPAYWQAHMQLLDGQLPALDDPARPVLTSSLTRQAARVGAEGDVRGSLVSPGCVVQGRVERSVLGPGVRVEAGAVVSESVILADTVIRAGASVRCAIIDERGEIGAGASVGGAQQLSVIGANAGVQPGERVEPGSEVPPQERPGNLGRYGRG